MTEPLIVAYHRSAGVNIPPTRLVIHATAPGLGYPRASAAGQALATAHYFQSPTSGGSAHHVADVSTIVRCLPDDAIAWHAPPNPHSLGYEVCGEASYTREQWLSPQVWPAVVLTAAQVKADAAIYRIPLVRLGPADLLAGAHGICGHVDVSHAWHQSDHTDPGPGFPWPEFMALLTPATPPTVEDDDMGTLFRSSDPADPRWFVLTASAGPRHIKTPAELYLLRLRGLVQPGEPIVVSPADLKAMGV
ncbi:MAG TPA: peptidoglycan recognition family protein [Nocardioidaceae bacterium]|nr:peptidoglycan recognition family protein [Nocardioidaceae bacterium]